MVCGQLSCETKQTALEELAWVQNAFRVEGVFNGAMQGADFLSSRVRPPSPFGQSNAVFTGDSTAPAEDLMEQIVQGGFASFQRVGLRRLDHHVDVDVAVPRVAEAGHGQAMFFLKPFGESKKVLEPAARHDDVLVEFGQAGIAQGMGEFAAQLPELFAAGRAVTALNKNRLYRPHDSLEAPQLPVHGSFLTVEFDDDVGAAPDQKAAASAFPSCSQCEGIGNFERARQDA